MFNFLTELSEDLTLANGRAPRPLMSIPSVMWRLDRNEDQVLELIENGDLPWCFNIATKSATAREFRILARDVEQYAVTGKAEVLAWEDVCRLLLPNPECILLKTADVTRLLGCSGTHVLTLVKSGEIQAIGDAWRTGPQGTAKMRRSSVANFLQRRCLQ